MRVVCVLKSGGDYGSRDVLRLREGVRRYLPGTELVCYSDTCVPEVEVRPLTWNLSGWFSKFEAFSEIGPAVYLDLDTVLVDDATSLVREVMDEDDEFRMLEAFNERERLASGIMGWRGDVRWMTRACVENMRGHRGDQSVIRRVAKTKGVILRSRHGIRSYKLECTRGLPRETRVVCFHGRPRPTEVEGRTVWMP